MKVPGVGVDVVDIAQFEETLERSGEAFLNEVFTPGEIAYCKGRRAQHFAVRFAAKEAFYKAVGGSSPDGIGHLEVEVTVENENAAPVLRLSGRAARTATEAKVTNVGVSLSHSKSTAVAVVMLETGQAAQPGQTAPHRPPLAVLDSAMPEVRAAFAGLSSAVENGSSLDARTRELVLIGILAALREPQGVKFHARKALELGATPKDIFGAVALVLPAGGIATVASSLAALDEVLPKSTNQDERAWKK